VGIVRRGGGKGRVASSAPYPTLAGGVRRTKAVGLAASPRQFIRPDGGLAGPADAKHPHLVADKQEECPIGATGARTEEDVPDRLADHLGLGCKGCGQGFPSSRLSS